MWNTEGIYVKILIELSRSCLLKFGSSHSHSSFDLTVHIVSRNLQFSRYWLSHLDKQIPPLLIKQMRSSTIT